MMYYLMSIGALVVGFSYAAVPLYRMFCQVRRVVRLQHCPCVCVCVCVCVRARALCQPAARLIIANSPRTPLLSWVCNRLLDLLALSRLTLIQRGSPA
jgi:hypothetical protein